MKLLCDRMNIKLFYSRPRHNQSKGKVERYHRALRSKMEYDLQKIGQYGVKWEKQLPLYQRILNNDPKLNEVSDSLQNTIRNIRFTKL